MKKPVHKVAIVYSVIVGVVSIAGFSYGAFSLWMFIVSFFSEVETPWGDLPFGTFLVFVGLGGMAVTWILAMSGRREVDPRVPLVREAAPRNDIIFFISLLGFFGSILVLPMVLFFMAPGAARWVQTGIPCMIATLFVVVMFTEPLFKIWMNKRRKTRSLNSENQEGKKSDLDSND